MKFRICVYLLVAAAPAVALAQQGLANVKIKTTPVAGNVYMLEGRGGNIGVSAGPDGVLMIDDQFIELADKIRAAIKKIAPETGELKFLLNTHWHADHVGGNPNFGADMTIIAHQNVRKRVSKANTARGRTSQAMPKVGWPIITFDESLSIHFNGEEIRMTHYPRGHTDGDSVIYFTKSNVIHMGDDFFAGRFPYVDLDSGGDVEGLTGNIRRVIKNLPRDVKIIPGHGPLATLDDLKAYHRMLVETTAFVGKQIKGGKTLAQIQTDGLPDKWQSWGGGFISAQRWIEIVHKSLSRKNQSDDTP